MYCPRYATRRWMVEGVGKLAVNAQPAEPYRGIRSSLLRILRGGVKVWYRVHEDTAYNARSTKDN